MLNGKYNDYFYYVNDRYIGSFINVMIINVYKNFILGKGFKVCNVVRNVL